MQPLLPALARRRFARAARPDPPVSRALDDALRRISCHVLALVWAIVFIGLCIPLRELRLAAGIGLVAYILLVLPRASLHIRILCLA